MQSFWISGHWPPRFCRTVLSPINGWLLNLSRPTLFALALALFGLLGTVDVLTGPELSLSLFYLGPMLALTWYAGKGAGVVAAVVGSLTWLAADYVAGQRYSHALIPVWNCGIRLGFFLLVLSLLHVIKEKLKAEEQSADTDALTGVANSRFFYEALAAESARSKRYRHPFTVAYMDLDNFKRLNDAHGHAAGDGVLKEVAACIRNSIRRTDIVARLGGDEFAALFPETDGEAAETVVHSIRDRLLSVMKQHGWQITVSIGAVTFAEPLESLPEMLKAADDLMYQAKKRGKNACLHRAWGGTNADMACSRATVIRLHGAKS